VIVLTLLLACACSEQAAADGVPPFPDGVPSDAEPADDLGAVAEPIEEAPSIVAVDRAAVEDVEAPSPLELLDTDAVVEDTPALTAEALALLPVEERVALQVVDVAVDLAVDRLEEDGRIRGTGIPWVPWTREFLKGIFYVITVLLMWRWRGKAPSREEIEALVRAGVSAALPEPTPGEVQSVTELALKHNETQQERDQLKQQRIVQQAEADRLAAEVAAQRQEIARLKAITAADLASQNSISEDLEAQRRITRSWIAE